MKPIEQAGLAEAPQVVRQQGQTCYGIHDIIARDKGQPV